MANGLLIKIRTENERIAEQFARNQPFKLRKFQETVRKVVVLRSSRWYCRSCIRPWDFREVISDLPPRGSVKIKSIITFLVKNGCFNHKMLGNWIFVLRMPLISSTFSWRLPTILNDWIKILCPLPTIWYNRSRPLENHSSALHESAMVGYNVQYIKIISNHNFSY